MINIENSYLGFTDGMKPMNKAKTENVLDGSIRLNGKIVTEKQWAYEKVKEGYHPELKENYQYYKRNGELSKPKTKYWLNNEETNLGYEVNKTLHDFALHIINNNFTDDESLLSFLTEEAHTKEEEKRIQQEHEAREKEEQERKEREEKEERKKRNIERLTKIQSAILQFTEEEAEKLNDVAEFYITECKEMRKAYNFYSEVPDIILHYDCMKFIALAKVFPEHGVSQIKYFRDTLDPNTKNLNRNNERYIWEVRTQYEVYKRFFGITDDMPTQTVRALLSGNITAEEARNRMQKNEQRKKNQEEKMKIFYRNDGKDFIEEKGEQITVEGYNCYGLMKNEKYVLFEERTGVSLARGRNKTEAIQSAKDSIEKQGKEKVDSTINMIISKYGISPLVSQGEAV